MIRLIIIIAIVYFASRALRSIIFSSSVKKSFRSNATAELDDVMVQDPYCKAYFSKVDAVVLNIDGKDLYFCSEECRDKFIDSIKKK